MHVLFFLLSGKFLWVLVLNVSSILLFSFSSSEIPAGIFDLLCVFPFTHFGLLCYLFICLIMPKVCWTYQAMDWTHTIAVSQTTAVTTPMLKLLNHQGAPFFYCFSSLPFIKFLLASVLFRVPCNLVFIPDRICLFSLTSFLSSVISCFIFSWFCFVCFCA